MYNMSNLLFKVLYIYNAEKAGINSV